MRVRRGTRDIRGVEALQQHEQREFACAAGQLQSDASSSMRTIRSTPPAPAARASLDLVRIHEEILAHDGDRVRRKRRRAFRELLEPPVELRRLRQHGDGRRTAARIGLDALQAARRRRRPVGRAPVTGACIRRSARRRGRSGAAAAPAYRARGAGVAASGSRAAAARGAVRLEASIRCRKPFTRAVPSRSCDAVEDARRAAVVDGGLGEPRTVESRSRRGPSPRTRAPRP